MISKRNGRWSRFTAAALALCAPFVASEAQGQETAERKTSTDEIIVTAQKREQSLQDVAGSISAFNATQLETAGVSSVNDLTLLAPGLTFDQHNGAAFTTLRGVGLEVDTGVAEPNVAIHVDGVYLSRTTMAFLEATDLERIEVLRGPQGTLYGRNATGGAINFISRAPSSQFEGEVQAGYGSFDTKSASAFISGPLSDAIRGRLSVSYQARDKGYVDNAFTGGTFDANERLSARGALSIDLASSLTLDLTLLHQEETFQTYQQVLFTPGPGGPLLFPPLATAVTPTAPWTLGSDYNPDSERKTTMASATLNWEATEHLTVKSITGYIDHEFFNAIDGDGTSASYITIEHREQPSRTFSQELNFSGNVSDRLDWLFGLYYSKEDFSSTIPVVLPSGLAAFSLPPGSILLSSIDDQKIESQAAFADATFSVTDRFRIYGGVRVARDTVDSVQSAGAIIPSVPTSLTLSCNATQTSQTFDSTSPRVGAEFDVSSDVMLYAQHQRGFKSGGLNSSTCGDTYAPERLDADEIGIKSTFFDRALTLNASLFRYDYSNLQLFKIVLTNAQIENADAEVKGAEVEARWRPNDVLTFNVSGTWLDAKITNFFDIDSANPGLGLQNLAGKRLSRTPEYSINFGVQGDFPVTLGPFTSLTLRADGKASGSYYHRVFNTPIDEEDAYVTLNLNAQIETEDGFRLRAFGRNVTDEAVIGHLFYNSIQDAYLGNYNPPATWGVEISKQF